MEKPPSSLNQVYHPPAKGARWQQLLSLVLGASLAIAVMFVLPFTQAMKPPGDQIKAAQEVTLHTPPPPPPKDKQEPPPPEESTTIEALEPSLEPLSQEIDLQPLDIALEPEMGDAIQGDFAFNFSVNGPVIAKFEVFELTDVDQPPRAVNRPSPVYPPSLSRAKIEGMAEIRFIVDEAGRPRNAEIIQATHPAFGTAAMDAVNRSTFTPSQKNGKAVAVWVQIPFRFAP